MPRLKMPTRWLPWLYGAVLAATNLFICRDAFTSNACGHWNSMHGVWMSLARLARFAWIYPAWWRYWGGGEPLSSTYAPLVPFAIAAVSELFHCSRELALNLVTAGVYCAGPLLFFLLSWRLSHRAGPSFVAAMVCSLLSPVELLMPDPGPHHPAFWHARRLLLAFEWDDLPHLTSLAFLAVAVWALARALRSRRPLDSALAGLAMAGMMLANMFGCVLAALLAFTLPLAIQPASWRPLLKRSAAVAALTYIVVSPWLPPSLLLTMRANESRNGEMQWSLSAYLSLGIVVAAMWIVWRVSARTLNDWPSRWLALFATPIVIIPALAQYTGWHFVPQPGRYRVEAEFALVWIAVFLLAPALQRIPRAARVVLLALPLVLAVRQAVEFHRSLARLLTPVDVPNSIQYRTARWVAGSSPSARVMMSGSLGTFLNTFTTADEFSAEPYTTGPNFEQKIAVYTIYTGTNAGGRDAEFSLLWLKAFGVHAVAVPGPQSPEYWKSFSSPLKFEGVLPVLWREDDTTIYRVPASPWLAHILRPEQLVRRQPVHGLDVAELRGFVAAMDSAQGAPLVWDDSNHARIATSLAPGEVVSAQITYHRGWRATANGSPTPLRSDGIGLMVIAPACSGPCEIRLEFDGGWEWKIALAASCLTLLALACFSRFARRTAQDLTRL